MSYLFGVLHCIRRKRGMSAATAQTCLVLFFILAILAPIIIFLIIGVSMALSDSYSTQLGVGLACIGSGFWLILFAFWNWKGHSWVMNRFTKTLITMALFFLVIYCFIVIFLPDYFTYNGCSAIFFALNYLALSVIITRKNISGRLNVKLLTNELLNIEN